MGNVEEITVGIYLDTEKDGIEVRRIETEAVSASEAVSSSLWAEVRSTIESIMLEHPTGKVVENADDNDFGWRLELGKWDIRDLNKFSSLVSSGDLKLDHFESLFITCPVVISEVDVDCGLEYSICLLLWP